jgi:2',3'-cyclic-nucleotide 2'-phosphodiesterase (5'-nucleotidase family)
MGNIFTRNTNEKLRLLENRLANLEGVDKDADGVVSKDEFELWKRKQKVDLIAFKQEVIDNEKLKHEKVLIEKDAELKEMKKEVDALKKINEELKREEVEQIRTRIKDSLDEDKLSEDQIKLFVEELLKDQDVNIGVIPDWAERRIYENVFTMLIGLIRKTVDTSSVKFMGHEVGFEMRASKK